MKKKTLLSFLILFFSLASLAQDARELWDELEVAMNEQSVDKGEFQAFAAEIRDENKINDFVEQSISTGLAGVQKIETPPKTRKKNGLRQRGHESIPQQEALPRANKTIYTKKNFKAPRQRSR